MPVIDGLECDGLARRGQEPRDRRRISHSLTVRGAEVLAGVPFVDPDDPLVSSLNRMDEAQSYQLLVLMRELVAAMSEDGAKVVEDVQPQRARWGAKPATFIGESARIRMTRIPSGKRTR